MANEQTVQTQNNKFHSSPRTIKINSISTYNEKYVLIEYRIYGHDIVFKGLFKKEKMTPEVEEYELDPDKIYAMFSDGPYINFLRISTRF